VKQSSIGFFVATFLWMLGQSSVAEAAAGWTDFGALSEFNHQPATSPGNEALFIKADVSSNPSDASACYTRQGFFLPIATEAQKRLFAMLLTAKTAGQRVRLYVTGNCHTWGYAELQGVVIE
jgi:hypothetical protein